MDELRGQGVLAQGYGITPKTVMQDDRLTIEAKAIYAYIASFAGAGTTAFPGKRKMAVDLKISEERLYTHRKLLIKCGYITVTQERGANGTLGKTVYTLEPVAIERPDTDDPSADKPCAENPCSEKPRTENPSYNNNRSKNNRINNNNSKKKSESGKAAAPSPSVIVDLYHQICPSFPRIVKLTDGRAKAIKARLNDYTLKQITTAFKMAEDSSFLKGNNERGWHANFDWIMSPGNMAKILEGNYRNKQSHAKAERNIEEEETL